MNRNISQKKNSSYREKSKKKKKIIKNEMIGGEAIKGNTSALEVHDDIKKAEPVCKIGKIGANGVIQNNVSKTLDTDMNFDDKSNFPYPHLDTKKMIFPFDTSNWHSTDSYLKCSDSKWILKKKETEEEDTRDDCIQLSLNISNIDCIFPEYNLNDHYVLDTKDKPIPDNLNFHDHKSLHENYINSINNSNRTTIIKETISYLVNNTDLIMDDFEKIQFEMEKLVNFETFEKMATMETKFKTIKHGNEHDTQTIINQKMKQLEVEAENEDLKLQRENEKKLENIITRIHEINTELSNITILDTHDKDRISLLYVELNKNKKEKAIIETKMDNSIIKTYRLSTQDLNEYLEYDKNSKTVNVVSPNDFDTKLKDYFKIFRENIIDFVLSKKIEVVKFLCEKKKINTIKAIIHNGDYISHYLRGNQTEHDLFVGINNEGYLQQTKKNILKFLMTMADKIKKSLDPSAEKNEDYSMYPDYNTPWCGFRNEMNLYEDYFDWYISEIEKDGEGEELEIPINKNRYKCRDDINNRMCELQTHYYNKSLANMGFIKTGTKEESELKFMLIEEYKYIRNLTLLNLWNRIFRLNITLQKSDINRTQHVYNEIVQSIKLWFETKDNYFKEESAKDNEKKQSMEQRSKKHAKWVNEIDDMETAVKKIDNNDYVPENFQDNAKAVWNDSTKKQKIITDKIKELEATLSNFDTSKDNKIEITEIENMITELNEEKDKKISDYVFTISELDNIDKEFKESLTITSIIDEEIKEKEKEEEEDNDDEIKPYIPDTKSLNDLQVESKEMELQERKILYEKNDKDGNTVYINNETGESFKPDEKPKGSIVKELDIKESSLVKLQELKKLKIFQIDKINKYCSFNKKLIFEILFRRDFFILKELKLFKIDTEWISIMKSLVDIINNKELFDTIIDSNILNFNNSIDLNNKDVNKIIIDFVKKNIEKSPSQKESPVSDENDLSILKKLWQTWSRFDTYANINDTQDSKKKKIIKDTILNILRSENILDSNLNIIDTDITKDTDKYIVHQYLFYCTKKIYEIIKNKILLRKIIDHYRRLEIKKCKNATDISFFKKSGPGDFEIVNPLKYEIFNLETERKLINKFETNSNHTIRKSTSCKEYPNCRKNFYQSMCFNKYFNKLIKTDFWESVEWAKYRTPNLKKRAKIQELFNSKKIEFSKLCCYDDFVYNDIDIDLNREENPELITLYNSGKYYALTPHKMILFIDGIIKYEVSKINTYTDTPLIGGGKNIEDDDAELTMEESILSCGIKIITPSPAQINEINSKKNRNPFDKNASGWNGSKWLIQNDKETGQQYYQNIESGKIVYDRSEVKGEHIENEGITFIKSDINDRKNRNSVEKSCEYFEGCNHKVTGGKSKWNQFDVLPNQCEYFKSKLCEHHQKTDYLNKHIYFIQNNFLTMGRGRLKNICVLQNCKDKVWDLFKSKWMISPNRNANSNAWFYEGGTERKQEYLNNLKDQLTNTYNQFKLLLNTYSYKKNIGISGKIKINLFLNKNSKNKINALKSNSMADTNRNTILFINPPKEPICLSCLTEYRNAGSELRKIKTKKLELSTEDEQSDNYKSVIEIKDYDYTNYFKNRCLIRSLNTYIESMKTYKKKKEEEEKEELETRNILNDILEEDNSSCDNKFGKNGEKILLSEINTIDIDLYYRDSEDLWINETNTINKTTERIFYSFSESGWNPVNKTIIEKRASKNEEAAVQQKVNELMEESITPEERLDRNDSNEQFGKILAGERELEKKLVNENTKTLKARAKENLERQSKIEEEASTDTKKGGSRILLGGGSESDASSKGYSDMLKMSYKDMFETGMGAFGVAGPGVILGGLALTGIAGAAWYYGGQKITESKKRAAGFYDMEEYLADKIEYSDQSVSEIMKYQRYPMNYHIVNLKMFSMFLIKIGSEVVEAENLRKQIDMIDRYYKDKPNSKNTRLKLMRNLENMHLRNIYYNKLDIFNPQKFNVKNIKNISNPCTDITYNIKSRYKNRGKGYGGNSSIFDKDGWGRKYFLRHNNWKNIGKKRVGTKDETWFNSLKLNLKKQEDGNETLKDRWFNCLKKQKNVYRSADDILVNQTTHKNAFKDATEQLKLLFDMTGGLTHPLEEPKKSIEDILLEEKNKTQPYYNDYWKKHSYEVSSKYNKDNERVITELIDLVCIEPEEKKQFEEVKSDSETPRKILKNIVNTNCWKNYPDMRNNIIYNWLRLYSYNNEDSASIFQWNGTEYETENNRKRINTEYSIFDSTEQNIYLKSLINILTMEGLEINGKSVRKDCGKDGLSLAGRGYKGTVSGTIDGFLGPTLNTENEMKQPDCGIKVIDPNDKTMHPKNTYNCVLTYIKYNYSFNNQFNEENYVLNVSERETSDKLYDLIEQIKSEQVRNNEVRNSILTKTGLAMLGTAVAPTAAGLATGLGSVALGSVGTFAGTVAGATTAMTTISGAAASAGASISGVLGGGTIGTIASGFANVATTLGSGIAALNPLTIAVIVGALVLGTLYYMNKRRMNKLFGWGVPKDISSRTLAIPFFINKLKENIKIERDVMTKETLPCPEGTDSSDTKPCLDACGTYDISKEEKKTYDKAKEEYNTLKSKIQQYEQIKSDKELLIKYYKLKLIETKHSHSISIKTKSLKRYNYKLVVQKLLSMIKTIREKITSVEKKRGMGIVNEKSLLTTMFIDMDKGKIPFPFYWTQKVASQKDILISGKEIDIIVKLTAWDETHVKTLLNVFIKYNYILCFTVDDLVIFLKEIDEKKQNWENMNENIGNDFFFNETSMCYKVMTQIYLQSHDTEHFINIISPKIWENSPIFSNINKSMKNFLTQSEIADVKIDTISGSYKPTIKKKITTNRMMVSPFSNTKSFTNMKMYKKWSNEAQLIKYFDEFTPHFVFKGSEFLTSGHYFAQAVILDEGQIPVLSPPPPPTLETQTMYTKFVYHDFDSFNEYINDFIKYIEYFSNSDNIWNETFNDEVKENNKEIQQLLLERNLKEDKYKLYFIKDKQYDEFVKKSWVKVNSGTKRLIRAQTVNGNFGEKQKFYEYMIKLLDGKGTEELTKKGNKTYDEINTNNHTYSIQVINDTIIHERKILNEKEIQLINTKKTYYESIRAEEQLHKFELKHFKLLEKMFDDVGNLMDHIYKENDNNVSCDGDVIDECAYVQSTKWKYKNINDHKITHILNETTQSSMYSHEHVWDGWAYDPKTNEPATGCSVIDNKLNIGIPNYDGIDKKWELLAEIDYKYKEGLDYKRGLNRTMFSDKDVVPEYVDIPHWYMDNKQIQNDILLSALCIYCKSTTKKNTTETVPIIYSEGTEDKIYRGKQFKELPELEFRRLLKEEKYVAVIPKSYAHDFNNFFELCENMVSTKDIEVDEFPLTIEFVMKPCSQNVCQTHPLWTSQENSDCEYIDAKNGGPSCQINELGCFSDLKASQMLNILKNNSKNPHTTELFNENQGNEIERKLDEMKKGLFDKLEKMKSDLPKIDSGNKIYKIGSELFIEFIYDNLMTRGHWSDVTSEDSEHTIISGMIGTYTGDGPVKKSPKKYTKMIMGKVTNVKEKTKKIMDAPVDPVRLYVVGQKFSIEKRTVLQLYDNEIAKGIVESKVEDISKWGKDRWDGIKDKLKPVADWWAKSVEVLRPLGSVFSGIAWLASEIITAAKNIGVQLLFILIKSPMLLYLLLEELKKWRTQICKANWFANAQANGTLDVYSIDEKVSELNPAQIQMWDACKSSCMWPLDLYKKMYGNEDPGAKKYLSNINKSAKLEDINKSALLGGDTLTENSYNEFMGKMYAKNAKCDEQDPGCGFGNYMMSLYLSYIGKLQNNETYGFSDNGTHEPGSLAEALEEDSKENETLDTPNSSGKHLKEWLGKNVDTKWKAWWKEHGSGVDTGGKKKDLDPSFALDLLSKEMEAHMEECVFKDIHSINQSWWETHTTSNWNKSNSEWGHHDERQKPGMQWGWGSTIAAGLAVSAIVVIGAAVMLPAMLTGALGLAINGALATLGAMITGGLTAVAGAAGAATITGAGTIAMQMIGGTYIAGFAMKAFHHQWSVQSVRGNNPELMDIKIVCQNDDILAPSEVHEKLKDIREGKRKEIEETLEKEIRDADAEGKTEWIPKGFKNSISMAFIKSVGITSYVTRNYQHYLDKDKVWNPDKVSQHRYLYNPSISPEQHKEISQVKAITKQAENELDKFTSLIKNKDKTEELAKLKENVTNARHKEKETRKIKQTKEHEDAQQKKEKELQEALHKRDNCMNQIGQTIDDMNFEDWSNKVNLLQKERDDMDYITYTHEEEERIQTGEERLMQDLFYQKLSTEIRNTLTELKKLKPNLNKCEKPLDEKGKAKYKNYRKVKFDNAKKKTGALLAWTLNNASDMASNFVSKDTPGIGAALTVVDNVAWTVNLYNGMNSLDDVLDPRVAYLDPWLEYIRPYFPIDIKDVLWLVIGKVFANSIAEWQKQIGNVKENLTTIKQLWQGCDALLDVDGFLGAVNLNMASKYLNKNIHRFAFLNALCRSANVRDQYNIFINNKSLRGGPFNSIKVPNGDVSMGTLDSQYIASGPYSTPVLKAAIDKGIFGKGDDIDTNYTYMANSIKEKEEKYNEILGIDSIWQYGEKQKKQQPYRTEIYDTSLVIVEKGENINVYSFKHDNNDYKNKKWKKMNIKDIDEEKLKQAKKNQGKNTMSVHAIKEYDGWYKKKTQDMGAVENNYVTIPVLEATLRWFEQQCTNDAVKEDEDPNDIVLAEEKRQQNITDCLKSVIKQRDPGAGEIFSDGGTHLITLQNCILHHSVNFLTQPIIHHSTVANLHTQKNLENGIVSAAKFVESIAVPSAIVGSVFVAPIAALGGALVYGAAKGTMALGSSVGSGVYSTYYYLAYEDPEPYTKYPFDSLEDWLKGEETKCGTDPNVKNNIEPINQIRLNYVQDIYTDHIGNDIPIILNLVENNKYNDENIKKDYYKVPTEFITKFDEQMVLLTTLSNVPPNTPDSVPTIEALGKHPFIPKIKSYVHTRCQKAELELKSNLKKIKRLKLDARIKRRKKLFAGLEAAFIINENDLINQTEATSFKTTIQKAITDMDALIENIKKMDGKLYMDGDDIYINTTTTGTKAMKIGTSDNDDNIFDNMTFVTNGAENKEIKVLVEIGSLEHFKIFLESHITSYISQLTNILKKTFLVEYKNKSSLSIIPNWIPKNMLNSTVFIKGDTWGNDKIDKLREYMKGEKGDGYGHSSCSIPGHRIQQTLNFESLYEYKSCNFYDSSLDKFKESYKWNSVNESELTIKNNTRINRYQPFSWFIEEIVRSSNSKMDLLNVNHTDIYKITEKDMKPKENSVLNSRVVYTQGSDWLAQYSNDIMTTIASNGKTLGKDTDEIMSMYEKHKVKLWKKKKEDESIYSQFINNEFPYNSNHDYNKEAQQYFDKDESTNVNEMFDSWNGNSKENLEFFYKFTGRVKPIIWNINDQNEVENPSKDLTWRRSRIEIANKVVRFVHKNENINELISSIPAFLKTIRTVQNQAVWVSKKAAKDGKLKLSNLPPGTIVKYNNDVELPFYKNLNPYEYNENGVSQDNIYNDIGWGLGEWIGYGWVEECGDCYLKDDVVKPINNYIQLLEQSVGIGKEFKCTNGKLVNNNKDDGKVNDGDSNLKYIATNLDLETVDEWNTSIAESFWTVKGEIMKFITSVGAWMNERFKWLTNISTSLFEKVKASENTENGQNGGNIQGGGGILGDAASSISNACSWISDTLKSAFPSLLSNYISLYKLIIKCGLKDKKIMDIELMKILPEKYYAFLSEYNKYISDTSNTVSLFSKSFNITLPSFEDFKQGLLDALKVVSDKLANGFNAVSTFAQNAAESFFSDTIKDKAADIKEQVKDKAAAIKEKITEKITNVLADTPKWLLDPTQIKDNIKSLVTEITHNPTQFLGNAVSGTMDFVKGGGFFGMAYSLVSSHIADKLHTDILTQSKEAQEQLTQADEIGTSNDEKITLCSNEICEKTKDINRNYESFKAVMEGMNDNMGQNEALDTTPIESVMNDETKITTEIPTSNNELSNQLNGLKESNTSGGDLISDGSLTILGSMAKSIKSKFKWLTGGGREPTDTSKIPFMSSKRMIHEHNNGPRSMQYLTDISNKIITNLIMHLWNEKKQHLERTDTNYGWNPQCIVTMDQSEVNAMWGDRGLFSQQENIDESWMKWLSCDDGCKEVEEEKKRHNQLNDILKSRKSINVCLDENNYYHSNDNDANITESVDYFNNLWNKPCNPILLSKASDVDISTISISDDLKEYIHLCNSSGVNLTMNPMNTMRMDPQSAKLKKQEFIRDKFRLVIEEKNECIKRKFERQLNLTVAGIPIKEEIKTENSTTKSYWNMLMSSITDVGSEGINISQAMFYSKIYCGELTEEKLKLLKKYEENILVSSNVSCISKTLYNKMMTLKVAYTGEEPEVVKRNKHFDKLIEGIGAVNDVQTYPQTKLDFENGIKNNLERVIKESIILADCHVNDCDDACKTTKDQNIQNEYKSIIDKNNTWLIDMKYYNVPNDKYFKKWQTYIFLYFIEGIITYIDTLHNPESKVDADHKNDFEDYIRTINTILEQNMIGGKDGEIDKNRGISSTFYHFKENVLENDFKCCDEDIVSLVDSKQNPFPMWFIQSQPHKNDFVLEILNNCHIVLDSSDDEFEATKYVDILKKKLLKIKWFQDLHPISQLNITEKKISDKMNYFKDVEGRELSNDEKQKIQEEIKTTFNEGRHMYDYTFLNYINSLLNNWKTKEDGIKYFGPLIGVTEPVVEPIPEGNNGWTNMRGVLPKITNFISSKVNAAVAIADSVADNFDGSYESGEFDGMDELMNVYYKHACENNVPHNEITKNWSLMNKSYFKLKSIIIKQIRKLNMYDLFATIYSYNETEDSEEEKLTKKEWSRILVLMNGDESNELYSKASNADNWSTNIKINPSTDSGNVSTITLTYTGEEPQSTLTINYSDIDNLSKFKIYEVCWKHGFSQVDTDSEDIMSKVNDLIFDYYDFLHTYLDKKKAFEDELVNKELDKTTKMKIWTWLYEKIKAKKYFQSTVEQDQEAASQTTEQRENILKRQKKDRIDELITKQKQLDEEMNKFKENSGDLRKATADEIYEIESQKIETESTIDIINLTQGYMEEFDDEVYRVIEYYLDYLCSYSPDIKFIDPKLEHSSQMHGQDGDMNKINLTDLLEQNQVIEQQYKKGSMA